MRRESPRLFDDIDRDYLGPIRRSEPYWHFLNRTGRTDFQYIREVLESWFRNYEASTEKRHRLWKKFRSDKKAEHLSAFFELYLYHLFKRQGFEIEVEPEWEQGCPDFLLTSPQGKKILLEATGTYPERRSGYEEMLDYLDDHLVSPDFYIGTKILRRPDNTPPHTKILRELQRKVDQLDCDQAQDALSRESMGLKRFPSITLPNDAGIEFIAIPKKGEERGKADERPIGSETIHFGRVDTISGIKARIDHKYGHYGELSIPYVLALNVVDAYADRESLLDALLGQEVVNLNWETGETFVSRLPGAWFGPNGPQKTRMSGICVFSRLRPENMHIVNPVIWHHPFANIPLEPDLVSLTQQIPNHSKESYELREGVHPSRLLQIDETRMPT